MLLFVLGLQAPVFAQSVVGGEIVDDGVWPDAAAVYFRSGVGCTGVLVAPDVVLTAGHCVGGIESVKLDAADYRDKGEQIDVAQTIEHDNSWNTYDVAVLILAEEARTPPRLIASDCVRDAWYGDGVDVIMAGWGANDQNARRYDTLLRAGTTVVADADCSDTQVGCNRQVQPDGELRAGGNGADACYGDSGGPLYLPTPEGDFLIGLTSRGYNETTVLCGDGTIYVRADAIVDWIEDVSGRTLERYACDDGGTEPGVDNAPPVPTVDPITVLQGNTATATIAPNDPNAGDSHSYAISVAPAFGTVVAGSGGTLTYTAAADHQGADPFEVTVSDNGSPAESAAIEVPVTVIGRDGEGTAGGCGCTTAPTGRAWGLVWALGLLVGVRRRS